MANVKIHVKLILQLRDAGMSRQGIASTRHISRNSVSEVSASPTKRGSIMQMCGTSEKMRCTASSIRINIRKR